MKSIFKTEPAQQLLHKKIQLNEYTISLEKQIRNILKTQNTAIMKKQRSINRYLRKQISSVRLNSQRSMEIQSRFRQNLQKVIESDIKQWDDGKNFYQSLSKKYQALISNKRSQNIDLKRQIASKKLKLKQLHRINFNIAAKLEQPFPYPQKEENKKIIKESKTELSLPSINQAQLQKSTVSTRQIKNNNRKRKKNRGEKLSDLLIWYGKQKRQKNNWFQRIIFADANYHKILDFIKQFE